ncbi:Asp/Glu/Hydantoin racemase [Geosmithia morbida]|uniref:Asp/Glu/Hydantoin racemase n=1 Tax=Geosmithia morbida TaxID=1094350 RepID=A0A9P4YPP0_9HYPO|nr:Asp/Glu/Hydantoin racemase [Geosmithia morbida]KAF4120833.1 Asp/Glu/Hydantoin racemase [Geosmithia morbida]
MGHVFGISAIIDLCDSTLLSPVLHPTAALDIQRHPSARIPWSCIDRMESLPHVSGETARPIKILLIQPNSSQHMTDGCLRSVQGSLPPNVTVYGFTGPETSPSAIEGRVDWVLSASDCFRGLSRLLGSSHDFDAFLVACFSAHPLIDMLREEYAQPTIGIMEAALYASRMCGDRLGILTTSERSSLLHAQSAAQVYGLGAFSVGCETGHVSVLELESEPRQLVTANLASAAKRLTARGADCICLGCSGMTELVEACEEAVAESSQDTPLVNIVDGVVTGVHMLTALVNSGLKTAKGGAYRSSAAGRARRGQDWI